MRLDLYQAETGRIAAEQSTLLETARRFFEHDYMNIDMARVLDLVRHGRYAFVADFLLTQP